MQTRPEPSPLTPQDKGRVCLCHFLLLGIVVAGVLVLDQLSKIGVFSTLGKYDNRALLNGLLVLVRVENRGAAFGILGNVPGSAAILTVTTLATIALLAVIFRSLVRNHLWTGRVALGLIYGGAIGNLIDRVSLGYVRDFIKLDLRVFEWPAFNVADIAIVVGIFLLLFGLASGSHHEHTQAPELPEGGPHTAAPDATGDKDE